MNYNKALNYFKQSESNGLRPFIYMGIGVFIIIKFSVVLGLILFILGALMFYANSTSSVSDEEYDAMVLANVTDLKEKALNKLGVDETEVQEIEPIIISGYDYDDTGLLFRKGKDGKWRTNKYETVLMFFAKNEVHCYSNTFWTTKYNQKEATDVYFYGDIVSASTTTGQVQIKDNKGRLLVNKDGSPVLYTYESFKLQTSGGTSLHVTISDTELSRRSINAMRQLLREKKING